MGKYTEPSRKCSTIIDKKTKATCDLYVGDHEWTEPEAPAKEAGETDIAYTRRIEADTEYQTARNEAQSVRGKAHRQDLSPCQGYTDDAEREID